MFKEPQICSSHTSVRKIRTRQKPILQEAGMSLQSHVETTPSRRGSWSDVVALEKLVSTINRRLVATSNYT